MVQPVSSGHRLCCMYRCIARVEANANYRAAQRCLAVVNYERRCMSDSSKRHTNSTHPDVTLDQFFDTSIGLLCITDKAGRFVKLNDEWTRVLGYELAELEGQACVQFIHPDDKQSSQRKTAALLAHNEIGTYTNRYRAKDGSYRWIQWRLQPYGEFVFAIARDVTSRKKTETELLERLCTTGSHLADRAAVCRIRRL